MTIGQQIIRGLHELEDALIVGVDLAKRFKMSSWSYGYTWPTDENMAISREFSSGIYPTQLVGGEVVKHKPIVWVTGETKSHVSVLQRVRQTINQIKLGTYVGGRHIYITPASTMMVTAGSVPVGVYGGSHRLYPTAGDKP